MQNTFRNFGPLQSWPLNQRIDEKLDESKKTTKGMTFLMTWL